MTSDETPLANQRPDPGGIPGFFRRTFGIYYGWVLVPVGWVIYGFGISPAFYSWGGYSSAVSEELGFDREQINSIFALFTLCYSVSGPLIGMSIMKFGLRAVMTFGATLSAIGFYKLSGAETVSDFYIYFSLMGGVGVGFSTITPAMTLASNWFIRYRARASAIVLVAGGIIGTFLPKYNKWMLENYDWRTGWEIIAGVSACLAVIAVVMVRNRPEDIGELPDGDPPIASDENAETADSAPATAGDPDWSVMQALKTPQFVYLTCCAAIYGVIWNVINGNAVLHMKDLDFDDTTASNIRSTMILLTVFGRFAASLGDIIRPQMIFGTAILIESLGIGGLVFAESTTGVYACMICVGLGFGLAYVSLPVIIASYFGRRAFATTTGVRFFFTGIVYYLVPVQAGKIFDSTGSYAIPFGVLALFGIVGAFLAFTSRAPAARTGGGGGFFSR